MKILRNIKDLLLTLVVIFVVLTFIINVGNVPSGSMEPTIHVGDITICTPLPYLVNTPQRGDIVIFEHDKEIYIKRIIGLPNESVQFINGAVYIDGELLQEDYLLPNTESDCAKDFEVPENCYFVMGDNREFSSDARFWENPYLERSQIKAKYITSFPSKNIIPF